MLHTVYVQLFLRYYGVNYRNWGAARFKMSTEDINTVDPESSLHQFGDNEIESSIDPRSDLPLGNKAE